MSQSAAGTPCGPAGSNRPAGGIERPNPGIAARLLCLLLTLSVLRIAMAAAPTEDPFADRRDRLVESIELQVEATSDSLGTDRLEPRVIRAMRTVPRERFVPAWLRAQAYLDAPLPIGRGQTISQPFVVAVMSHLLDISPGDRVYELGTGSGYQAAVLAQMGAEVYSVEIVPELAERAAATLAALGYDNAHVRQGDGYRGWPEAAPFDGVIVTAAHPEIPEPLLQQLKVGGRMVMPVGDLGHVQQLMVLTKQPDGSLAQRRVLPVRFVPITGPSGR
jgi:protein-L-isoaspartate(D-aspartate) O-methyltransferase